MMNQVLLLLTVCVLLFTSCSPENLCVYEGLQVVEKSNGPVNHFVYVRQDKKISHRIYVVKYDYERAKVGQTINCETW
jgi:hypothetical protein